MRIAIVGMGAIGHVVRRALEGRRGVELVAIDRTKAQLRPGEAPVDVAIVTTKTPGTEWASNVAGKILAPHGVALTIQNGLGNFETLAEHVGHERAAVGVIYVAAQLVDGKLRASGAGKLELGRPTMRWPRLRLEELAMLLAEGGMEVRIVDDPWPSVWRKLVTNAAVNPLTALTRKTNADLLADPASSFVADALAREVARVASAYGVAITEDEAVRQWRAMAELTGASRSSMLQDVEAGRPTEVEAINGAVYRHGAERGVGAPINQAMAMLVGALDPTR